MRNFISRSLFALPLILGACAGDPSSPTAPKGGHGLMWDVSVFPRGSSIPKDSTLALSVKALDYNGNEIKEGVSIAYQSEDVSSLTVDQNGVVKGLKMTEGNGIGINITVTAGPIEKQVTTYVGVTATPVVIDSISIKPLFGSPTLTMDGFGLLRATAYDTDGTARDDVYALTELENGKVTTALIIDPASGFALVRSTGKMWIYSSTYVSGKLLKDSVEYTLLDRITTFVDVRRIDSTGTLATFMDGLSHDNVFLQKEGTATFRNSYTEPVDIIFDRPEAVTDGNILGLTKNASVTRKFSVLGNQAFTVKSGTLSKRSSLTITDNQ